MKDTVKELAMKLDEQFRKEFNIERGSTKIRVKGSETDYEEIWIFSENIKVMYDRNLKRRLWVLQDKK